MSRTLTLSVILLLVGQIGVLTAALICVRRAAAQLTVIASFLASPPALHVVLPQTSFGPTGPIRTRAQSTAASALGLTPVAPTVLVPPA